MPDGPGIGSGSENSKIKQKVKNKPIFIPVSLDFFFALAEVVFFLPIPDGPGIGSGSFDCFLVFAGAVSFCTDFSASDSEEVGTNSGVVGFFLVFLDDVLESPERFRLLFRGVSSTGGNWT